MNSSLISSNDVNPNLSLPLLPLKDIVIFPHMIIPVFVHEELCINAVEESLASERKIFLSAFKVPNEIGEGLESHIDPPFDVYDIGTVSTIMRTRKLPDGRMKVLVQGLFKAKALELKQTQPCPIVEVKTLAEPDVTNISSETEALTRMVKEALEKLLSFGKIVSPDILMLLSDISDPARLADLVASNLGLKVHESQKILATINPIDRLKVVYGYLMREIEVYQMQIKIQNQAKDEITKLQKEHYLREQIKAIKNELGDLNDQEEIEALWQKVETVKLTDEAKEEVTKQIKRLERINQDSSEAALTRTYIDTILSLPWGIETNDNLDLKNAQKVLDEDHFGLKDVKNRIIEFLAVKKLNSAIKSPILCFVGPPGVGKTSLGKSIARAMGRHFSRISLGGIRDEADIRGHRKTYVGAFPGRIIQSIKLAGSSNPVIMLDEIDKVGADHRGDPAAALLEALDPEQNKNFIDHYLNVSFDLSKVMFIANANQLDTVPPALKDRLEIIEISGYTHEEKIAIAEQYLVPKELAENGLDKNKIIFNKSAISTIISNYTRESGVRGLEKKIAAICRKIARNIAENDDIKKSFYIKLTSKSITKYLGAEEYIEELYNTDPSVGVALGMAYTPYGGEILTIETNKIPSESYKLILTGKLGEVMKESAQTAISYLKAQAPKFGIDPKVFDKHEFHIHIPMGAIPKEGPSAGIAITTSILSCILNMPPEGKIAMSGEITLRGNILPVGGMKEKLLAALREKIPTVIIPQKNKAIYMELPNSVKRDLQINFVQNYEEVFEIVFPSQYEKIEQKTPRFKIKSVETKDKSDALAS